MSTAYNFIAVNTGSSSIKLVAFTSTDPSSSKLSSIFNLSIYGIGQPTSTLQITTSTTPTETRELNSQNYTTAAEILIEHVDQLLPSEAIVAIGHRLVHGGVKYTEPTPIKDIDEADWNMLALLDPEHTQPARELIRQFTRRYPSIPQIACFDTAFFHHLPHISKLVPIPQKYYDLGIRNYGFHGLSYTSLLSSFQEKAGETAKNGRVILAHLGSGASITATKFGKPIDTTMGFTPTSGIIMSTRSGNLDPHIFSFLHQKNNMSIDDFTHMVNFESGLLGISNTSGDMATLLSLENKNENAALAVELFIREVKKTIGAFSALLGGVDSVIFSGGIGEQSSILRTRICQNLEYLGIEINQAANEQNNFLISTNHSKVGIHVIASDEARIIALQTKELIDKTTVR